MKSGEKPQSTAGNQLNHNSSYMQVLCGRLSQATGSIA
jgi:hypothetical protein